MLREGQSQYDRPMPARRSLTAVLFGGAALGSTAYIAAATASGLAGLPGGGGQHGRGTALLIWTTMWP